MKAKLTIEETLRYESEIIVEQPESMSDEQFEAILSKVERASDDAKDIAYYLQEKFGIKVIEVKSGFPNSPSSSELEIIDVSNIKETQ
jgi:hypothetical protein